MRIVNIFYPVLILMLFLGSCNQMSPYVGYQPMEMPQMSPPREPEAPSEDKIKVALLLPLSGTHKELGTALLNAATLSLFDNDHKKEIELVIFDSKGTPFGAKDAIKDIILEDIKVIIGPVFSSSTEAIAEIVKNNNMTVLSFSNNMDLIEKQGIFLMGLSFEQQIEKIVDFALEKGKNNFSVIAPNNQYGLTISNILKQTVKNKDGNFITSQLYINTGSNLDSAVKRLVNSYIVSQSAYENLEENVDRSEVIIDQEHKIYSDTILIAESGEALSKIAEKIKEYNTEERRFQIIGTSGWDKPSTVDDPNLQGGWFAGPDSRPYQKFENHYYQLYGQLPPRISSIAYDAVYVTTSLINQNKSKRSKDEILTSEDLIYYQKGFQGMDGLFRFLPNGAVERNLSVLEVDQHQFNVIEEADNRFLKY